MRPIGTELEQRLDELRSIFQQQLPGRVEEILHGWESLYSDWNAEHLTTLQNLCHSLAGSGATFGAHEEASAARTLENLLKKQRDDSLPTTETLHQLTVLMEQLSAAAHAE